MSYIGNKPQLSIIDMQVFQADGQTDTFTLPFRPGSAMALDVYVNKQWQEPLVDFNVTGDVLSFDSFPASGRIVVRFRAIEGISYLLEDGRENLILRDQNNDQWQISVDENGNLQTSLIS